MSIQRINEVDLYYETHGAGRETLLFSHGLLFSTSQFHHQIEYFKRRFHILAYDHRGQGRSAAALGPNRLTQLADDAAKIIESRHLQPVHYVGSGLGGLVGLRLALDYPDLIRSLMLVSTDGQIESRHLGFQLMRMGVMCFGFNLFISQLMHWLFGPTFMADEDRIEERLYWQERLAANRKAVVRSINETGHAQLLANASRIQCPTLLMAGTEDRVISLDGVRRLQTLIPGAQLKLIYQAGHNPLVEEPHQCHHAMEQFLRAQGEHEALVKLA